MEELLERWKMVPLIGRLAICLIVGGLIPVYLYMDTIDGLSEQLSEAEGQLESMEAKYNRAKRDKTNMPELEKKLEFVEKELVEAKKRLPDFYKMDSLLEFVANSAEKSGLTLLEFKPENEVFKDTGYSYVEMPINLKVTGNYNQIGVFFDEIVHMEKMVQIRDLEANRRLQANGFEQQDMTPEGKLAQLLDSIKIDATAKLVVFRSARPGEGGGGPQEDDD